LKVDAFARGFGGDKHLRGLAEFALGKDARAGRVAVANLHAAVNLRDGQVPIRATCRADAVFAVAAQKIERVLVLGEDEQLHLRVFEDALLGEQLLQPTEFTFDSAFSRAWQVG
jgi:hypothetical protein